MQGEKPVLSEVGVRPAMVITTRSTEARTFHPLAQDRSQSPPNKTVNVSESRSMGLLEISEPALEDGIEFADDGLQAIATGPTGLFADFVPQCHTAFRSYPTSTGLKSITQKVKPLSFVHAVAHAGFLRIETQSMLFYPSLDRSKHRFGLLPCATQRHKIVRKAGVLIPCFAEQFIQAMEVQIRHQRADHPSHNVAKNDYFHMIPCCLLLEIRR